MDIKEMKVAAINEISKIEDEKIMKEILEHLSKLSLPKEEKVLNLSQHYDKLKKQYGNVLAKLAK